jgi:hypothetical protein
MMMAAGGYLEWSKLELEQLWQHLLTGRSMRHYQPEASFTGKGKESYRRSLHLHGPAPCRSKRHTYV